MSQLAVEGSREEVIGRVVEYLSSFFPEVQPFLFRLLLFSLFPFSWSFIYVVRALLSLQPPMWMIRRPLFKRT